MVTPGPLGHKRETGPPQSGAAPAGLVRRLGLFDATMLVMGGIIGTGIFVVPQLVAKQAHTRGLITAVWLVGGIVAICGALVYAELTARYPEVGGQYAYLREAYHPIVAFLFGWALLLVMQTGAIASVAMIFSRYFIDLTRLPFSEGFVSGIAIATLTLVNCLGVRTGSTVQNFFMLSKIAVIGILVTTGLVMGNAAVPHFAAGVQRHPDSILVSGAVALVPVLFTYSGWQAAGFVAGEVRNPRRNMPLATVLGVLGVILLYCLVSLTDVHVLGVERLANTEAPASAVMRIVLGPRGAAVIAVGIMIAALGYISQAALTAPRVYYAMARDGVFFSGLGWISPRTRVPVLSILLQGVFAIVISLSGRYDQVLNYVMSVEFIFFCLTGISIFIFRKRDTKELRTTSMPGIKRHKMLGHPFTTLIFVLVSGAVAVNMVLTSPKANLVGLALVSAGIPVYVVWRWQNPAARKAQNSKPAPSLPGAEE